MSDQYSATKDYVAIIDIGSNAVRLVVYDGLNRAPFKIHSERTICNLGADLATTGCLNPDSVEKALVSIRRFSGLLTAMRVRNIRAVATAAVRDAKDGKSFVDKVFKETGLKITVIDGEEEARLAALGVLANGLGGHGVIGDYGGGSLELIVVEHGQVKHKASLPIGSHRMLSVSGRVAQMTTIEEHLDKVEFLKAYTGKDFYAMGGAWRSMATAHMHMSKHPLRILDHYQMSGREAVEFADLISHQSMASLEKTVGMSKKRLKDMGVAALTMELLFEKIRPKRLIFSGTGLREGALYDQLKPGVQEQDALIASCAKIAMKISRFDDLKAFKILFRWMMPLFEEQDAEFLRLLEASCLLSDGSWFEHEDYQADHAFERTLVMPFYGIDHAGRAFLALSQYVRYKGYLRRSPRARDMEEVTRHAQKLLDGKMTDRAIMAGRAQRIGYALTGGAVGLLKYTQLKVTPKHLTLKLNSRADMLDADIIAEPLQELAKMTGRDAAIEK